MELVQVLEPALELASVPELDACEMVLVSENVSYAAVDHYAVSELVRVSVPVLAELSAGLSAELSALELVYVSVRQM